MKIFQDKKHLYSPVNFFTFQCSNPSPHTRINYWVQPVTYQQQQSQAKVINKFINKNSKPTNKTIDCVPAIRKYLRLINTHELKVQFILKAS